MIRSQTDLGNMSDFNSISEGLAPMCTARDKLTENQPSHTGQIPSLIKTLFLISCFLTFNILLECMK